MSLSRRSSSSKMREDEELSSECKAAFLTEYDDLNDRIESKQKLIAILQMSGRNLTNARLNKYWSNSTSYLSFNDFKDICIKEKATSSDDLMKAFKRIDINGDGYISLEELFKIMNKKEENMSRDKVRQMIDEVDDNKDGKLDYREFTNMVMKTTEESKRMSVKMMERKERKKKRGELSAAMSETGKISDPIVTNTNIKSGSQVSLRNEDTDQTHLVEQGDITGSNSSLKSERGSSKAKSTSNSENQGSSLSLQKRKVKSSTTSLRSDSLAKTTEDDVNSSKVSLRGNAEQVVETETSINVSVTDLRYGSKVSIREKEQGSQVSLASKVKENLDIDNVAETAKRPGSASSHRSQSSKQEEIKITETVKQPGLASSQRSQSFKPEEIKSARQNQPYIDNSVGSLKPSPKPNNSIPSESETDKAIVKNANSNSAKSKSESSKHDHDTSLRTPRSKLGIPSITVLERPRSSYTNTDMTGSESANPKDSARSVGEEIDYDDDIDIVSTGRPTPRVSLSSRLETPKAETPKSAKTPDSDKKKEEKDDNDVGSQSSLRSGDKEAPVPSPRKSVTRGFEDDIPRPSPRVRSSKTKSPSTSLRSKLPDPKSLENWSCLTSKGCFFYEEDEIVSHVYSLKLQDDSTVYLSAGPIQEPSCLSLPGSEPIDTALYVFDSNGSVVTFTEQRDIQGTFGVKLDLAAGDYQILPYTTGCRFKQQGETSSNTKKANLVKKSKDDKIVITSAFREALKDIFDLCDLDGNGTMSKDEFNWFNVRTSGEELGDDEWEVVEEKTTLENGEITKTGFIELNELEAEDAEGDVEDLWITLTSMGMNKSLMMDEACPFRLNVYIKEVGRRKPRLRVTGIESLEKREFVTEICQSLIAKAGEPTTIRRAKDLYLYTYKNDYRSTIVIDNRSRSTVNLEIDCSKSRNVISNRTGLDHTFEIDPQQTAIAHHLMPKTELSDWSVVSTEKIP